MSEEINIKVKTLDSSVHEFIVAKNVCFRFICWVCGGDNDISSMQLPVLELKAKLAEKTNVPINMQRIIFKGKVLHDDKDLSFYCIIFRLV